MVQLQTCVSRDAIECEGAADLVDRVVVVDVHLGSEEFPVEVRSAKKMDESNWRKMAPSRGIAG